MSMFSAATVTRFAPSPSGELHLGNVRTALFNALLARRHGGRFVLRIEDTDAERSDPSFTAQLFEDLRWLGLDWDEGPQVGGPAAPYQQSARAAYYEQGFAALAASGHIYPCYCTPLELDVSRRTQRAAGLPPRYAGTCRDLSTQAREDKERAGIRPTLRFRVKADQHVEFVDLVHGPQSFRTEDIGDFVVRRADRTAAFFFSNAVDDAAMGVTHVLRGEDHLSNTPRQLLLLSALGQRAPVYGHLALVLGDDGAPLSKRLGAPSLRQLREQGYLPTALHNLLFRLGHSTPLHDLLDLTQMAAAFDTAHLGRAPARCDPVQLHGWQQKAAQHLPAADALRWLGDQVPGSFEPGKSSEFVAAIRANVVLPADAAPWARLVCGETPVATAEGAAAIRDAGREFFAAAAQAAADHGHDWKSLCEAVRQITGRRGPQLFKPLRFALTGTDHGPELAPLVRLMPAGALQRRFEQLSQPDNR